ncbi:MAG TPA: glucose-6-phosphate dehydrogenase assembly protein OpcA [Roseiflexaceae bacterium]|nr:glucose-6-phosphate dehydrogenase assembly protein OpcA [Roseiflexaceae bacterium]
MTTTTTSAPLGERTHIDVRAIERELNDLWKQLAEGEEGETHQAVTRTCVLNLIVVTGGGRAAERATETVARLTGRHPNRAFVISAAPNGRKDVLDAWVQTHCQMPSPGRPQVCGEQISIEARGAAVDRVPGTLLPLLLPDVPVMLWWPRGEPSDDPRFLKFADYVDRVIVDSATFAKPEAGLVRLAALLSPDTSNRSAGPGAANWSAGANAAISDLAWSRLTPWRELTAQFFDAPALVPHLSEITRVTLEYEAHAGGPADRSQALLLLGWLAARLGWAPGDAMSERSGITTLGMVAANGEPIAVELHPAAPADDLLDRLSALTIECRRARFNVARDAAPDCAVARSEVEGMQPIQRKVRLERLDEASLIGEELRLLGHDQTFELALMVAAGLIERAG